MTYTVRTTHVQRLIGNALDLARRADGTPAGASVGVLGTQRPDGSALVDHALAKAAADLRHAAEELEAERLSCLGWTQV